ncbi:hypothetical protein ACQP2U_43085 (plasmid) [Nocardia sp. CA-084685]|uniref:hypothetical protein n=1 Tax=Nocardia sp. CA-084685 TaxID=3239970 RepID=UPI003D97D11A
MSTDPEKTESEKVGGLPADDPSLDAFAAQAAKALPRRSPKPEAATQNQPAGGSSPRPAPSPRLQAVGPRQAQEEGRADRQVRTTSQHQQQERGNDYITFKIANETITVNAPRLGPAGEDGTNALVNVDVEVRDRFEAYQDAVKQKTGSAPTNGVVVRRAFKHARKADSWLRLLEEELQRNRPQDAELDDDEDDDLAEILGDVNGRRAARGRVKNKAQQSFRPSKQELASFDAIWEAVGFPDRSGFINAMLHDFLPEGKKPTRARRSSKAPVKSADKSAEVSDDSGGTTTD